MLEKELPPPSPEVLSGVKKIIERFVEEKNLDFEGEATPNTSLRSDLGLDSLQLMELITNIEEEMNVEIPLDSLVEVDTIEDAARFVSSCLNN